MTERETNRPADAFTGPDMMLSLCLEMLFADRPFLQRMEAAARIGYPAIEFWDWRDKPLADVGRAARDLGLQVSTFSGNRDWTLIDPRHRRSLLEELEASLDAAARLACPRLMLLTDRLLPDGRAAPLADGVASDKIESLRETLAEAAALAAGHGVTLLLEPLNTRLDHRGYFLDSSQAAFDIVRRVGSPWVRVLYDVYHMTTMGEDVSAAIEAGWPWLGYVHVADVPGRHEPGSGRIDFARIRATLERLGYAGPIGLEFSPSGPSDAAARQAFALLAPPSEASE